ncbi:hypothetical protein H7J71_02285 [Mycolicibacterium peregrinum]|uniref:hypothetical protein n=1 Tax=Mycolicibacterium peregrinum TaxID=43304 RepID=UPI0006D839A8|nr:hypothetical protein [Mycolicibacterium peregrinum]MCV7200840.1 hypothetical protein [Mycolicibacterium peregrinum]ORW49784.1 hypothetical protein AWC21_01800 [Mycolicibacterium peregrinum]
MTTAHIDPWATADHDPSSITETGLATNTTATLEEARSDLHNAVAAVDNTHRRVQYARSALDNAVTVLLAYDATPDERRRSEHYIAEAEGLIANTQ